MILPGEWETSRAPFKYSGARYLCRYCQKGNVVVFLEKIGMYQRDSIPSHLVYCVMTASLQDSNNVQNQTHIICHLTSWAKWITSPLIMIASVSSILCPLAHAPILSEIVIAPIPLASLCACFLQVRRLPQKDLHGKVISNLRKKWTMVSGI